MDSETSGGETPSSQARAAPNSSGQEAATPKGGSRPPGSPKAPASRSRSTKTTSPRRGATTKSTGVTTKASATDKRRPRSGDDPSINHQGPASPSEPLPWPDRRGVGRGRSRNPDLYNRQARANERWPVVTRILARTLARPEVVLRLLGQTEPLEREGRVLNPGLQAMLAVANRFGAAKAPSSPAEMPSPFAMRRQLRRSARAVMPVRTDVYAFGRVIPGPENAPRIGLRVYRQFGAGLGVGAGNRRPLPAIVYFHGGGWVSGDLDSHDALCRILAAASGCLVVSVDYRLAPEYPFPAAVDDALAAYAWVHDHGGELGIDPDRIGVMGDSAGANLAAVVAQVTRARPGHGTRHAEVPPPVAQGLVYPMVDARLGFESMRSLGEGFLLTGTAMEYYRDHYLPDRSEWENPLASPLLAGDLGGLAPALVVTAGFDPLRDDGLNYAEALRRAGVAVVERRYEDQIHGFMIMGIVSDSLAVATEVCESMGRLMRRPSPVDGAILEGAALDGASPRTTVPGTTARGAGSSVG